MRLLHATALQFHEFEGSNIPEYAILSHRWEEEEVTYHDMQSPLRRLKGKAGLTKVRQCCRQAVKDGYDYVWIDTCCIDKTFSAELSEAINSMYQWYQKSAVCYAYLSDVQPGIVYPISNSRIVRVDEDASMIAQIYESKWWTRGWTLQELIAPRKIKFFGSGRHGWLEIGDKSTLLDLIVQRSGIHGDVLCGVDVQQCSVAMRMSWAADRETTRPEDLAYCLLGIFGVNMPLLYGEGDKAFLRLQEEIMKQSDDQTLFAWDLNSNDMKGKLCGPLAISPSMFRRCSELLPIPDPDAPTPYSMTNKGLRFELPIVKRNGQRRVIAILQCTTTSTFPRRVTLPIVQVNQDEKGSFARDCRYTYPLKPVKPEETDEAVTKIIFMKQEPEQSVPWRSTSMVRQHIKRQIFLGQYRRQYSSLALVPARTETENRNAQAFVIPPGNSRGAIIYGDIEPNVLVLFSIGMQHRDRFSCKVLHIHPSLIYPVTSTHYLRIQELLFEIKSYIMKYNRVDEVDSADDVYNTGEVKKIDDMANIEQRLVELHDYYTTGSNSRTSFIHFWSIAVSATIAFQIIHGQSMLVLNIILVGLPTVLWPFQEIEGDVGQLVRGDKDVPGDETVTGDRDAREDEDAWEDKDVGGKAKR